MIKLKNVERIFAFGCSFTKYYWPTWADVIASEVPEANFLNFGICGGGNLSIVSRMVEANQRFKFNNRDLVVIMWTTMCREDRWVTSRNGWAMTGNIFTQSDYSMEFVEKWCDPKGYLIRDLSLISLATQFLQNLKCQTLLLPSVPFDYQQDETDKSIQSILKIYDNILSLYPKSLLELELNYIFDNTTYYKEGHDGIWEDYHPTTLRYRNYLEKINLPLTDKSKKFALESLEKLQDSKTLDEISKNFNNLFYKDNNILL